MFLAKILIYFLVLIIKNAIYFIDGQLGNKGKMVNIVNSNGCGAEFIGVDFLQIHL